MKQLQLIDEFKEELSRLTREIETSSSMGLYDVNKIAENLFCELFKEIFGFKHLKNLNDKNQKNYPSIDLADDSARIAIQVTSDSSLDKVKETLKKFINHELNEKYDKLLIYIITTKQGSYSQPSIDAICGEYFAFDAKENILDYRDVSYAAAHITPLSLKKAVAILKSYTRGCETGLALEDFDPPMNLVENLTANLLQVFFPSTLYIADIIPEIIESKNIKNQRREFKNYVNELQTKIPSEFEINKGKIITFHDLESSNGPFSQLIDYGTVECLNPSDFYTVNSDYERIFKSLLRFSLQSKLYKHKVHWQYLEKLFIFLPLRQDDLIRKEAWQGLKKSTRTVFDKKMQTKDSSKVLSTKHFAFRVDFIVIDHNWYTSITPDWFFSYGEEYRRSGFADKLLSGLKRMEKNRSVFDQFRFLSSWLTNLDSNDLFSENTNTFLSFGSTVNFPNSPLLDESLWEVLVIEDSDDYEPVIQKSFGI